MAAFKRKENRAQAQTYPISILLPSKSLLLPTSNVCHQVRFQKHFMNRFTEKFKSVKFWRKNDLFTTFWVYYEIFLNFFNCYLAGPRPTLSHCQGGSLINPMLKWLDFDLIHKPFSPPPPRLGKKVLKIKNSHF